MYNVNTQSILCFSPPPHVKFKYKVSNLYFCIIGDTIKEMMDTVDYVNMLNLYALGFFLHH